MEDVIQTLIDLHLAHTGTSTIEMNYKQQGSRDQRHRRRQKINIDQEKCDDNNNLTSILAIDEDLLHKNLSRLLNANLLLKTDQHIFYSKYLRLINRR